MSPSIAIAGLTTLAVLLLMAGEAVLSSFNERQLRARGAIEPPDDVIGSMRWAYPGAFILMGIEGALGGPAPRDLLVGGLALFGLAKDLVARLALDLPRARAAGRTAHHLGAIPVHSASELPRRGRRDHECGARRVGAHHRSAGRDRLWLAYDFANEN